MKVGIMQPYFLPYIGYWQLVSAADVFVVYDNIQYTKKGWFNKNRYLLNGKDALFSINLQKDSDLLNVNQRYLSSVYKRNKLIAKLENAYHEAPMKKEVFPIIERIINCPNNNLFDYIYNSIMDICDYLNIKTKIVISSAININHSLKSEQKVIAICREMKADSYINPIGGMGLYSKNSFASEDIVLTFIKSKPIYYKQFDNNFVEWLSILDVMMFNTPEEINMMMNSYDLL
jgi:hypothetical protein